MKAPKPASTALPGLSRFAPYTYFNKRCPKCNEWLALTPGKDGLICMKNSCTDQPIHGVTDHRPIGRDE